MAVHHHLDLPSMIWDVPWLLLSLAVPLMQTPAIPNINYTSGLVPLYPVTSTTPHIPPIVITTDNSSVQYFVKIGTHQQSCSDSSSNYSVSINGRPYWGPIFDANGQKINWLINQMLQNIILLIVWYIIMLLKSLNNIFANQRNF